MGVRDPIIGICIVALVAVLPGVIDGRARAESYLSVQERRPDLFHEKTGFRIARHRAPTPDDIPLPARVADAETVARLLAEGAVAIDVSGALQSRFDELEGTWLVRGPRQTLPGTVWLPEVGRGVLEPEMESYLADNIASLTEQDRARAIVVFCMADCWMSWNAAQRISALGYEQVYWFREGTNGWLESGRKLVPVMPKPVAID